MLSSLCSLCKKFVKYSGSGAVNSRYRPVRGMHKAQYPGMEALTLQLADHGFGPVDRVASHRMAQARHMHPDLVGAAGLQLQLDMGKAL